MSDAGTRPDVLILCRDRRMGRGLVLLAEDNGLNAVWQPSVEGFRRDDMTVFLWADADDAPELTRLPEGCPAVLWTDREVREQSLFIQMPGYPIVIHRPFDEERLIRLTKAWLSARPAAAIEPDGLTAVESPSTAVLPVPLTPNEQKILECLRAHKGTPVTRAVLRAMIGENADTAGNMVDVYVSRLRDKLEKPNGIRMIVTVRGIGYMIP